MVASNQPRRRIRTKQSEKPRQPISSNYPGLAIEALCVSAAFLNDYEKENLKRKLAEEQRYSRHLVDAIDGLLKDLQRQEQVRESWRRLSVQHVRVRSYYTNLRRSYIEVTNEVRRLRFIRDNPDEDPRSPSPPDNSD